MAMYFKQRKYSRVEERFTAPVPTIESYERSPNNLRCLKGGRLSNVPASQTKPRLATIVTVVRNSAATLHRTIDSIREQSYPDIEYIVVDGGSTDGTLDILRRREAEIDLWLSEPDRGISDAFNKGIALSTGEFIALVNGDDWLEPDHIAQSIDHLTRSCADFSFGNLMLHDDDGIALYMIIGDARYSRRLHHAMPAINHPSLVCRKDLYVRHALFDVNYRIAMDYEWLLRNYRLGAVGTYISSLTSHMGSAGVSQRNIRAGLSEVRKASVAYGYPAAFALLRYHGRRFRANARIFLERWLPRRFTDALHGKLNSSYRSPPGSPATNT